MYFEDISRWCQKEYKIDVANDVVFPVSPPLVEGHVGTVCQLGAN